MYDPAAGTTSALLITEQVLVFAVFVGSVAALPAFIEFVTEVRKRKERIDLSLEDELVSSLRPRLAGMDDLLNSIADLIDRARNPAAYQDLKIGNEVLIIGPNQTGKKSLAQKIAQLAGMDRVVTVFNPRDSDALAKAKSLVRGYKGKKVMLLLPRIDLAYLQGDPEVLTELDALIETTSERQNVLVAATTVSFEANSDLDNIFGIKFVLPGARVGKAHRVEIPEDAQRMLAEVANFYLTEAKRRGFVLQGLDDQTFCERILESVINPAEVEDIVALCETTALYRKRSKQATDLVFTAEILELAMARVVVG
jgi:energy-coupling factor transporter ATP-binding protein EcfA2